MVGVLRDIGLQGQHPDLSCVRSGRRAQSRTQRHRADPHRRPRSRRDDRRPPRLGRGRPGHRRRRLRRGEPCWRSPPSSAPTRRCRTRCGSRSSAVRRTAPTARPATVQGLSAADRKQDQAVSERGHGGLPERRLLRPGRQRQRLGGRRTRGFGHDRAGARRPAGQDRRDRPGDSSSSSGTTNRRSSMRASRSAARRTATQEEKTARAGQSLGRAGLASVMTAATTTLATPSTTSIGTCSTHYLRALAGTVAYFATSTADLR